MDNKIKILNTDLVISRIGLGTVNAGLSWDGHESFEIFDTYVGSGFNLIDCARVYSDWIEPETGRAERVVGDWIRQRGKYNDITLITKGGHPRLDTMKNNRLSRQDMEGDLDLSLHTLGVDCIDIYCYHRDDESRDVSELIDTMERFVKEGKIKYYACSNWKTSRMKLADEYCHAKGYRGFVINQALYNAASNYMKPFPDDTMVTADSHMIDYHLNNDQNILVPYMSLCSGFFHILDLKGESAVKSSPYFTEDNLKIKKKIDEIRVDFKCTITQILLGYLITRTPTMVPLMSADNLDQLREAVDTVKIDFGNYNFSDFLMKQ